MKTSPISILKSVIKDQLFKDLDVAAFLGNDAKKIQRARFSVVGEKDIPLITVSTVEEDIKEISQDFQDRSTATVLIEIFSAPSDNFDIDDFAYHVRTILRSMDIRSLTKNLFITSLKTPKIVYIRDKSGTKKIQHIVMQTLAAYDDEYSISFDGEEFAGATMELKDGDSFDRNHV